MDPTCGLVDGLVGKFRDLVVDLIWEELLYFFCYDRNIDQLDGQHKELTLERNCIQHQIDEARNNVEQIEENVLHWLVEVDELSKQVQKFQKEESQAKVECNLCLRYILSKRAKAMTEEVAKLYANRNFEKISYSVPLLSVDELTNIEGNERIASRVPIMNQILEELRNPGVNMIGLCGLGGVGKTTIAKEVAKNQKIFKKVIIVTVSQKLNIGNIQGEIAEKLTGKQLIENNIYVRASHLCERLKQEENMLLILDDLWEVLDLGKVGNPLSSVKGCKILLTSRDKSLLSHHMKCQKIVEVGVLSEDEALELFKKIAELSTDSSSLELIPIATDIVRKCGGLPLAIVTAAKALRKKDFYVWKDARARLNNPLCTSNTLRGVDTILKLSYDFLSSSEYKNIFLLAAMLSHDPSIEDLLMYSVGLNILDRENMEDARVGVSAIVIELKSLNLFLDSISSHHVTIHDVFRDAALRIASDEGLNLSHFVRAFICRRLKEWPDENMLQNFKGICIQESEISDLQEELRCPRLQFLFLNSTKQNLNIPNMFFESSGELKMLAFTNVHFSSLSSLSFLNKLNALCLHSCLLEDIIEIRSLKKLKVLSLAYSEIQQLPVEVAELTSLQMLNLSCCSKLKVIPKKLLSRLKKLEVLYMASSFNQWKVEGSSKTDENASLDELMGLPISCLEIHIPSLSMLPQNLFLKMNLMRYRISIGETWEWRDNYGAANKLKLELPISKVLLPKLEILELFNILNWLTPMIWDDQLSHNSFNTLKVLVVKRCGFVQLVPLHVLKSLNNLEEVSVIDCDMLEIVFDFEDLNDYYKEMDSSSVVVPLKKLKLRNLPKLKNVWSNNCQGNVSFPSLRSVIVDDCESLKSIFPASIAKGKLCYLEEVEIRRCGVEVIVANDDVSESVAVTFGFPKLTSLRFSGLPNLRSFYPQKHTLEWPHLNQLSIQCCDELEIFEKEVSGSSEIHEEENMLDSKYPLLSHDKVIDNLERLTLQGKEVEKIGSSQFLMYFPKLKQLHLSLEKEPSFTLWERSPNLRELKLSGDFEKALGGDNVAALAACFPKLTLAEISIMGSLSPFLVSSPILTHLNVNSCHEWTTFMTSSIARSLVHLTHLSIGFCPKIEEIITKQEGEDDEDKEIVFVKMKFLTLIHLPTLRRFCRHNYTFKFLLLDQLIIKTCPKFKIFSPGLIETPSLKSVQLWEDWEKHHIIWDTDLNKTFYCQRFVASRVVLDEDDAIMIRNEQFPIDRFPQVEILGIEGFVDEWVTFPYTLLKRFPKLSALHVENCSFEEIFPSHAPSSTSFHNLTELKVSKCHQLVYLGTCSTVRSLVNLEILEMDDCEKMEEIVRNETNEDVERGITFNGLRILKLTRLRKLKIQEDKKDFNIGDRATNTGCTNIPISLFSHNKVLLPKLETLELSYLSNNLISLIWDDQLLHNSFNNLKTLMLRGCGFMKTVPLRVLKYLNNLEKLEVSCCNELEMVFGFQDLNDYHKEMESSSVVVPLSLTHLEVNGCQWLTSLMTSSAAPSLVHITHLSISDCDQIEDIITKQEGEDDVDMEIIFNQMKFMELDNLPRLKRFCGDNYNFRFPLLEHVTIIECPRLTMFCPGAIHAPLLQSIQVDKYEAHKNIWKTDLNSTIQHLFTFQEVISTCSSMTLNSKNITMITDVFSEVSSLYVESFTNEGVTFPNSSLEKFPKLDWLNVEHCSFEEIFPSQDQIIDFMGKISPFEVLCIADMDKLKSIWKDDSQLPPIHQNLTYLRVESCCSLVQLAPSSASFQNLEELFVYGCHQLIHLVTTSTAKNLVSLWWLEINDCKRMEEIVMNDTDEDVQGGITFNRLCSIELTDMPSLKMFSPQSHIFEFPELEQIEISGCPEMKKFCPGVLKTPKLSRVKIEEHDMEWKEEEDLNKTMEGLSSAKASINI